MQGVSIIELYDYYSAVAIIDVVAACICVIFALVALCMAFENKSRASYFVTFALFFLLGVSLAVMGVPHVHEREFRAKVDNVLAWSEISVNYSMIDLDDDGVFTFRERK